MPVGYAQNSPLHPLKKAGFQPMIGVIGRQMMRADRRNLPIDAKKGRGDRANDARRFLILALSLAHARFRLLGETGHTNECAPAVGRHWRGTIMENQTRPLSGWEIRGDLACLLCSRTVASAQGPRARKFVPSSVRVHRPEHASAVREMRCPYCTGRLWLQDTEEIFVDRRPLSAEELRPRRGRPPKVRPAADQPAARAS